MNFSPSGTMGNSGECPYSVFRGVGQVEPLRGGAQLTPGGAGSITPVLPKPIGPVDALEGGFCSISAGRWADGGAKKPTAKRPSPADYLGPEKNLFRH